jgi:predicted acetyltransferase
MVLDIKNLEKSPPLPETFGIQKIHTALAFAEQRLWNVISQYSSALQHISFCLLENIDALSAL